MQTDKRLLITNTSQLILSSSKFIIAMATFSAFFTVMVAPQSAPSHSLVSFVHTLNPQFRSTGSAHCFEHLTLRRKFSRGERRTRVGSAEEEVPPVVEEQPAVSVPVSPSDTLTMFFQVEGVMNESAIPKVLKALEGTEGISNLKAQVTEGIASVELRKETTVQATGVASGLVEAIQGAGFKLQTLNLSFADKEEIFV
ncbi:hypothetical protein SAY87_021524 [Trapa incisa]|uniref:HMA domain-containing protein n=1 Tax=Trapa incisa TaxID=236973 RepID=A0AAN7JS62_9MYRT|nr:hypothetical protein SAY87_021524 [Trapa incisa]